ncbi:DUF4870 family protein [Rheinheimera baltica]|uniref:Transmembrane protein n=1 Tax=Rheinheimera baltica TaxID=67576 RepID=A0ABT9HZN1_9GAMM|nr:DUF4870 domain-containing protein [Rheinheimera baltica]MDP5136597.1 hypothetical protein [Rheinheimera baltica]MDP5144090.1 hypothetical protein [Rheinheimera baltica]MDP5148901.1 hypothetical protein [Rheinheimera baltica]MDP5189458.1 hypothetical protein [Rheinheimera baltica]
MNDINAQPAVNSSTAKLVYILYLVGIIFGVTGIVGVVMAYINKSDAPEWLQSHYRFQIRTFWIGLVYILVSVVLMMVVIGWLTYLLWIVWLIIRSVKGMKQLEKQEAVQDEKTWLF